jgi:hypothetical protein
MEDVSKDVSLKRKQYSVLYKAEFKDLEENTSIDYIEL